jgi:cell pole-organizing protein PopZ
MSTPSERIWAAQETDADDDLRAHLTEQPPPRPETLANVAARVRTGVPLRSAVADFLDDLRWARDRPDVDRRIVDAPSTVDEHVDAYLAALAEHVASRNDIPVPQWAVTPDRFLDHFWWPSRTRALRARALVESPAAFRRRGIFIGATTLARV